MKAYLKSALLFSALAVSPAFAASVVISDTPMAVQNTAKSNIVFTIDDSGGMDVEVLLPTFNSMYYESGVTPGNNPGNLNGNFFLFPAAYRTASGNNLNVMLEGDVGSADLLKWRPYNAHYNPQYYDPYKTYVPWPGNDQFGNPFQNATPTAVRYDPFGNSLGIVNLLQPLLSGQVVNGWTIPQAHTYLSPAGLDITSSGGRYYNSSWYQPMYYTWIDMNANGVLDAGEGVRYEIKDPNGSCAKLDPAAIIPGCNGTSSLYPSGRTYASEIQNFANWFQYYRTTMLSMQGAVGKQIGTLGATRVGMTSLRQNVIPSPVADMSIQGNMSAFQDTLYNLQSNLSDWRQPIHERMSNVYNYFRQTGTVNGVPAPIQYACQQNFNILATPGYLNENGWGANTYRNYFTGVTPSAPFPTGDYDSSGSGFGATKVPYADFSTAGNPSYSDTLADWSLFIYNQNLRPDLTPGMVATSAITHETNANPHLDTYVIAPGAVPVLGGSPRFLNPKTTDPYSINPPIDWPRPSFVSQSTVDDLWHAAVNGRGMFVSDTNIYGGLSTVLNDILSRVGAAAAVAVSNANVSPGDNFSYASSYNAGNWSGDVQAYTIDLATGQPSLSGKWVPTPRDQLDALVLTSGRKIATYTGSAGVPFRWANLSAAKQNLLTSPILPHGIVDGSNVLNFIRGDRSLEGVDYRVRAHALGDIIDAEPVIVREPMLGYADNGYAAYKAQYTTTTPRVKVVYQAGNDGMIHAFDAINGSELWAYIPGLLFNSRLNNYPQTSTLAGLSMKSGYSHQYMVDGTPTANDVDFNHTFGASGAPDWRTILVGGLRKGGRGYYALDVTQPVALNEADVAAKAVWEFPSSNTPASVVQNIGYSFGKPIIVKTPASGWVVMVASGYNNGTNAGDSGGDGQGHLFVLNAKTGALIRDIATGVGTPSTPSGLANISGWVDDADVDVTAKQVYGTDLQGNVWRFDFTATTVAGWSVTKLTTLVDAAGTPQPITTAPDLALVHGRHMIYVGTGQYLSANDVPSSPPVLGLPSTQVQSMYGLIDDLSTPASGVVISPLRSKLTQQTMIPNGTTRTINTVPLAAANMGWYMDMSSVGERIITDPAVANTTLVFTTNIPSSSDPCAPGGSSWLHAVNYSNGGQVAGSSWVSMSLGSTLVSRPILVRMPDGTIKALARKSNATTTSVSVPSALNASVGRKVSWREITR